MTILQEILLSSEIDKQIGDLPIWTSRNMLRHYDNVRSTLSEHVAVSNPAVKKTTPSKFETWMEVLGAQIGEYLQKKEASKPKLPEPLPAFLKRIRSRYSYLPPMHFYQGAKEIKIPKPIAYLIEESTQKPQREFGGHIIPFLRKNLPFKGILRENARGLLYLEIDDGFIHQTFSLIRGENVVSPPYFYLHNKPEGAHIIAMLENERKKKRHLTIEEVGEEFSFEVKGLYSITPEKWDGVEKVWYLEVFSEELEKLREKYHLPAKVGGHPFHIAVGISNTVVKRKMPTMRINAAFLAA